jgi:hypothetical protein
MPAEWLLIFGQDSIFMDFLAREFKGLPIKPSINRTVFARAWELRNEKDRTFKSFNAQRLSPTSGVSPSVTACRSRTSTRARRGVEISLKE